MNLMQFFPSNNGFENKSDSEHLSNGNEVRITMRYKKINSTNGFIEKNKIPFSFRNINYLIKSRIKNLKAYKAPSINGTYKNNLSKTIYNSINNGTNHLIDNKKIYHSDDGKINRVNIIKEYDSEYSEYINNSDNKTKFSHKNWSYKYNSALRNSKTNIDMINDTFIEIEQTRRKKFLQKMCNTRKVKTNQRLSYDFLSSVFDVENESSKLTLYFYDNLFAV